VFLTLFISQVRRALDLRVVDFVNEESLVMWPEDVKLEGRGEIYLHWKNLALIALVIILPLIIALFFESFVIKVFCWGFSFLAYMIYLPVQGPCVTAIAVGALPWYVFFEWKALPRWLAIIATIITLIEISYIRHRMHGIERIRKKENLPF
jgi:hypothetical protein